MYTYFLLPVFQNPVRNDVHIFSSSCVLVERRKKKICVHHFFLDCGTQEEENMCTSFLTGFWNTGRRKYVYIISSWIVEHRKKKIVDLLRHR
jgi:hypothetical protein